MTRSHFALAAFVLGAGLWHSQGSHGAEAAAAIESPVVLRFATVGDSRQQPRRRGNTPQDERWLQATAVWSRILHEIEARKPQALFFNGDMIYGYTKDMAIIDRQYAFWRGMVAGLMESGTYVVPVPGNHEVQVPLPVAGGGSEKRALATHEQAWRANMGDLIVDEGLWQRATGTRPSAWSVDNVPSIGDGGITTDQRQLSFSFDSGTVHIAVVNTDPVGLDNSAPSRWLEADFLTARARGARTFLVFGHKPAYSYEPPPAGAADRKAEPQEKEDGLEVRPALRDEFWDVIEAYGATYFCGHQHLYHSWQPRRASGGKAWQVVVGTAGSPLGVKPGQSADPFDSRYAWAEIAVHANGAVEMQVRGFAGIDDATSDFERIELQPAH
jgi:hypothetical protein